jgi:hypothetical protein
MVKLGDLSVFLFASFVWKNTVVTSVKNVKMCSVSQRFGADHGKWLAVGLFNVVQLLVSSLPFYTLTGQKCTTLYPADCVIASFSVSD